MIRPAEPGDIDRILELNNAAVPAVSVSDRAHMVDLVEMAALAWVVDLEVDGGDRVLGGFVLLFEPGSAYASPNYGWFVERYERFLYVDRVVIAEETRDRGLGAQLYEAVIDEATQRGSERVTAEVNLEPPNPGSSRFHRRMGFEAVGTLSPSAGYTVEMLSRPIG